MHITKDDIAELRGGEPHECDFCNEPRSFKELEPEEAGMWACHSCMRQWHAQDVAEIREALSEFYSRLDCAKWWFSKQKMLGFHTPFAVLRTGNSEALLHFVRTLDHGVYR